MIGKCETCGAQVGALNLKNGTCKSCLNESGEAVKNTNSTAIVDNETSTNKIVHVNLHGGLIGFMGVKPNNALNIKIAQENRSGWRVVQIIPSASGNLFLAILRIALLVATFGLYTREDGYYVVMERIENKNP